MQAIVKVESPVKLGLPTRVSQYKTKHLPDGALGLWRTVFIPTFAAYIGTKHTPWEIKDKESHNAMQDCWSHVYRSTTVAKHRLSESKDIIFHLVSILALVKYRLTGPIG
jgi:hypothetical protein